MATFFFKVGKFFSLFLLEESLRYEKGDEGGGDERMNGRGALRESQQFGDVNNTAWP